jgi:hypothetical protein
VPMTPRANHEQISHFFYLSKLRVLTALKHTWYVPFVKVDLKICDVLDKYRCVGT